MHDKNFESSDQEDIRKVNSFIYNTINRNDESHLLRNMENETKIMDNNELSFKVNSNFNDVLMSNLRRDIEDQEITNLTFSKFQSYNGLNNSDTSIIYSENNLGHDQSNGKVSENSKLDDMNNKSGDSKFSEDVCCLESEASSTSRDFSADLLDFQKVLQVNYEYINPNLLVKKPRQKFKRVTTPNSKSNESILYQKESQNNNGHQEELNLLKSHSDAILDNTLHSDSHEDSSTNFSISDLNIDQDLVNSKTYQTEEETGNDFIDSELKRKKDNNLDKQRLNDQTEKTDPHEDMKDIIYNPIAVVSTGRCDTLDKTENDQEQDNLKIISDHLLNADELPGVKKEIEGQNIINCKSNSFSILGEKIAPHQGEIDNLKHKNRNNSEHSKRCGGKKKNECYETSSSKCIEGKSVEMQIDSDDYSKSEELSCSTTYEELKEQNIEHLQRDAKNNLKSNPMEMIFLEIKKEPDSYDDLGIEDCYVENEVEKTKHDQNGEMLETENIISSKTIKTEKLEDDGTSLFDFYDSKLEDDANDISLLQCSKCGFEAESQSRLIYHLLTHNELEKKFKCPHCSYSSDSRYNLKSHQLIHNDYKQFKCPECSYEANNKGNLKYHMLSHNDTKLFQCPHCNYGSNSKYNLKLHMFRHENSKRFKCTECDYEANNKGNLKYHLLSHTKLKLYQCSECSYGSNSKYNLKIHIWSHSKSKRYSCSRCTYQTNSKQTLLSHETAHDKSKVFKCSHCDHEAGSRHELKVHTSIHKEEEALQCQDCGYKTKYKHSLKSHALKHNKMKLFKCPDCEFETNYKSKLKLHSVIHVKKEGPLCCPSCSFETVDESVLKAHLVLHNSKKFQCSECDYASNYKTNLVRHLGRHQIF